MKSIGIALGGGGVRGLAHVLAIEVFDEFGLVPKAIAGTSMGSLIGALYASGISGAEIREGVREHIILKEDRFQELRRKRRNLFQWLKFFRPVPTHGAVLSPDGFLRYLLDQLAVETFEELKIPFYAVATDFEARERVVFEKGPLLPALKASMAIPGVFEPVVHEGRVLVDGGVVENLPHSVLVGKCDAIIAIDVTPTRRPGTGEPPKMIDALLGTFDTMTERATREAVQKCPPAIYLQTNPDGIRILDFDRIEDVYEQAAKPMDELRRQLEALLKNESE
ncbi:MAG: patatin-like phospholipase family protein [Verrucomicrobiales bacterium]|nr:patatin-like phospholipase family protein [Verrucomicrobiales bacterium]